MARRPRLVVRVGITGHRPSKLEGGASLAARVRAVIDRIQADADTLKADSGDLYLDDRPSLRLYSALAEGADRIGAAAALDVGAELACILPYFRDEYERDFNGPQSVGEFRSLLSAAGSVIELDGSREDEQAAYTAASRLMLRHVDVLIAVWDGQPSDGGGGTADTLQAAVDAGIPTVWLSSSGSAPPVLLAGATPDQGHLPLDILVERLRAEIVPPGIADSVVRDAYHRDALPGRKPLGVFRRFRAVMEAGMSPSKPSASPEAGSAARREPEDAESQWADALAGRFAEYYRDSFIINYVCAALAVAAALVGFATWWGTLAELILISTIVTVTRRGRRGRWHQRWLMYRLVAEQLRQRGFLSPIGATPAGARAAAHEARLEGADSWPVWFVRARVREQPLPSLRFDAPTLAAYVDMLTSAIDDQVEFHHRSSARAHHTQHRLHKIGFRLFVLTIVICFVHLWTDRHEIAAWLTRREVEEEGGWRVNGILTFFAAALPALGAALAGIENQGEFERVAARSHAMATQLEALVNEMRALVDPSSAVLRGYADRAAEMMMAELADWERIFSSRPLELPS